jgi:2-polyprenyl-3-methyl-5-hydroxy-6-metoxy-1,4-benzoquinol methylase
MMEADELKWQDPVGFETLDAISKADQFNYWMFQTIAPYIKGNVLELGSGIGNISNFLTLSSASISLSDYNPVYCQYLKKKFAGYQNIKAVYAIDLQKKDFELYYSELKENFDTIILLNVIEHLEDDKKAIANCQYLLKTNGNLIVLAPAFNNLYSAFDKELGHYRRYTISSLSLCFEEQPFRIVQQQYFNALGFAGWLVINKLSARRKLKSSAMKNFNRLVPLAKALDKIVRFRIGLSAIVIGQKL